jgi:MFS family permease
LSEPNHTVPRWLIYVFAAVMDMVGWLIAFVAIVRAAKLGASVSSVAALGATESATYLLVSYAVGRLVTPSNSSLFILWACTGSVIVSGLFSQVADYRLFFPLVSFSGLNMACFFVSFQIFMKSVDEGASKPLPYSAGTYTFAWSAGCALGPLVAGFLIEAGHWGAGFGQCIPCYLLSSSLALLTAIGTIFARKRFLADQASSAAGGPSDKKHVPSDSRGQTLYSWGDKPDLAWVGWIACGAGLFVFFSIMRLLPKQATLLNWQDSQKGLIIFIMLISQALTALLLRRTTKWFFDWRKIVLFGLSGAGGLFVFAIRQTPGAYYLAAALFGIYSGSFFFYYVFHALRHPSRAARYVSINETVVGCIGVLGPLLAGAAVETFGFGGTYALGIVLIAAALVFQAFAHYYLLERALKK